MSTLKVSSITHPSASTEAIKVASDGTAGIAAVTTNAQSGTTYTFVLDDAGKLVTASNAAAKTFTIPPQSSVTWPANSIIQVVNYGAGNLTIAGGSGVTVTNATKTLAQFESAALVRTGSNAWTLLPFSGGVGNATINEGASTGYSKTTATVGGTSYNVYTWTASGTLAISASGVVECFILAGGGAGGSGGGGGGSGGGGAGGLLNTEIYLNASNSPFTVTVGAGASSNGASGNASRIGLNYSVGGGGQGANGGSGGGGGFNGSSSAGGSGLPGLGNNGSTGVRQGGGGSSAAATGQNGGAGINRNTFDGGSSLGVAGGGGGAEGGTGTDGGANGGGVGAAGANAPANRGGGGGGGGQSGSGTAGGQGGSGLVMIRVRA